ncbi:LytR/AlgR family response regulator transcription factor [Chryseolinea soli]|uniref:DNA-binding response regulator n=1 Tax=Chryseolinea soli TaxID=2321403 RepID=A0A385SHL0_9BACT|nr:response regulator transcription factor [Chryseolinea soli]AYB29941.1 DNA-binding response regulator [Chryseolinea soli]
MKLNCLIIDDEPVARKGLEEHVQAIDFLRCVASCEDALKAAPYINEQKIDLIYLDIHMPKITGIDFLKTLRNPPITIFTTAYSDHAVEGYSLDVIDYLVKPITFERFLRASQKAMEYFQLKARAEQNSAPGVDYYFVRCDRKFEKVFFRDISYVEGMQNYVIIHTGERKLITYITLASLEEQMPKDQFLRVHKSFLISLPHVKAIEGDEIILENARVPIGRTLREQVVQRIIGDHLFKR